MSKRKNDGSRPRVYRMRVQDDVTRDRRERERERTVNRRQARAMKNWQQGR